MIPRWLSGFCSFFFELARQRECGRCAAKAGADYHCRVVFTFIYLGILLIVGRASPSSRYSATRLPPERGPRLCVPARDGVALLAALVGTVILLMTAKSEGVKGWRGFAPKADSELEVLSIAPPIKTTAGASPGFWYKATYYHYPPGALAA